MEQHTATSSIQRKLDGKNIMFETMMTLPFSEFFLSFSNQKERIKLDGIIGFGGYFHEL